MFRTRDRLQLARIEDALTRVENRLGALLVLAVQSKHREEETMATADETLAAVQAESTVVDSVLALLNQIKADPNQAAKLDQVIAAITSDKAKMEAVILANTPQQP